MVSEILRSDERLAYLPFLDLIPPFHEMLDHIEHTWANNGHVRLYTPVNADSHITTWFGLTSCQGIRGVSRIETVFAT